ncbi:hypothetical protein OAH87_05155 [Marinomonas sp.]|nr:hypothetical protein [Marinomonas sp.]MDB4837839.1 hypothetical protein [Marinomonas sp.]
MDKVIFRLITLVLVAVGIVGCNSNPTAFNAPSLNTTSSFYIEHISLVTEQLVTPDIEYHTQAEIEKKVSDGVYQSLSQKGLLSDDTSMTTLNIEVVYQRRFVGDKTPIPSDSLAPPIFDYVIALQTGDKEVSSVSRKGLTYNGGFAKNLKIAGGLLRKKSDEEAFINALVNSIVETIEAIGK